MSHIVSSVIENGCVSFIKFQLPEVCCCFFSILTQSLGRREEGEGVSCNKMTYRFIELTKKPPTFTKILQQYLVGFQSDFVPLQLVGPVSFVSTSWASNETEVQTLHSFSGKFSVIR